MQDTDHLDPEEMINLVKALQSDSNIGADVGTSASGHVGSSNTAQVTSAVGENIDEERSGLIANFCDVTGSQSEAASYFLEVCM